MKIRIICVGKNKNEYIQDGVRDFIGKLNHYCRLEVVYLKDEKVIGDKKRILDIEAENLSP